MSDDDWEYGEPSAPPAPPTERDGLKVGDDVMLVGMQGQRWPAVVEEFTHLECDLVVRWTGVRPSLNERNTVCRKHLREIAALPLDALLVADTPEQEQR